jgi:hypothetical protein
MRNAAFVLAVLAIGVMASTAVAGPKWTDYADSGTYADWAFVDGNWVSGTWTYDYSYRWYSDGSSYQVNGQYRQSFVSDDGTITGQGIDNWSYRWRDGAATNSTSNGHINYFGDTGLIGRTKYVSHYTFNANGELTSNVWHYSD